VKELTEEQFYSHLLAIDSITQPKALALAGPRLLKLVINVQTTASTALS
jgi:hypothetical protein